MIINLGTFPCTILWWYCRIVPEELWHFFETKACYIALAVLNLSMYTRMVLNLPVYASWVLKGVHQHACLNSFITFLIYFMYDRGCTCTIVCTWKSEDELLESVFFFCHSIPWDYTQTHWPISPVPQTVIVWGHQIIFKSILFFFFKQMRGAVFQEFRVTSQDIEIKLC